MTDLDPKALEAAKKAFHSAHVTRDGPLISGLFAYLAALPPDPRIAELEDRLSAPDPIAEAIAAERDRCANIALAIDSGRGNEKEIARAIREGEKPG